MTYKAIIFDLFGTLVPYVGLKEFKESLVSTAAVLGCSLSDLEQVWCTEAAFKKAVTTAIPAEVRISQVCMDLGLAIDKESIAAAAESRLQAHRKWLCPRPSSISALMALRSKGYRLGLMSVCSSEVPALWSGNALSGLFDAAVFSCEVGLLKSDESFFLHTCNLIGVKPAYTVYVGDAEDELIIARQLGMLPVLMRTRKRILWDGFAVSDPLDVVEFVGRAQATQQGSSADV